MRPPCKRWPMRRQSSVASTSWSTTPRSTVRFVVAVSRRSARPNGTMRCARTSRAYGSAARQWCRRCARQGRQYHQHGLPCHDLRHAVCVALHGIEGGGGRIDARPRARARSRQHSRQQHCAIGGAYRKHPRVLRREARARSRSLLEARRSSATFTRRTFVVRCCGSPPSSPPSSPGRPSRSMAGP